MLTVQLLVAIFTLVWAAVVVRFAHKNKASSTEVKDPSNTTLYILPIFTAVLLLTVFRGENTGADYDVYASINNILQEKSWSEIWSIPYIQMEPLLLAIFKLLSYLQLALIPFLFISTLVVLTIYYKTIRRYSKIVWLSLLLLFCFASYFTIFNTTAQMFVSLIVFAASVFLYKGKFFYYALVVIAAALLHKTALFMLPMYFLLRYRPKTRRERKVTMASAGAVFILAFVFFDRIIELGALLVFPEYKSTLESLPSVSSLIVVKPLLVVGFIISYRHLLDLNDTKERVWFNAVVYTAILSIFALQFGLIQRFTYFLLPYMVLIVPLIIYRMKSKRLRTAWTVAIVMTLFAYVIATNLIATTPFSFIWEN